MGSSLYLFKFLILWCTLNVALIVQVLHYVSCNLKYCPELEIGGVSCGCYSKYVEPLILPLICLRSCQISIISNYESEDRGSARVCHTLVRYISRAEAKSPLRLATVTKMRSGRLYLFTSLLAESRNFTWIRFDRMIRSGHKVFGLKKKKIFEFIFYLCAKFLTQTHEEHIINCESLKLWMYVRKNACTDFDKLWHKIVYNVFYSNIRKLCR